MPPLFLAVRAARRFLLLGAVGIAALAGVSVLPVCDAAAGKPSASGPNYRRPSRPREGDILRIFDGARVYVVTNSDDPTLPDVLLVGTHPSERRILSVEEAAKLPPDLREYVTLVYLIDREALPPGLKSMPPSCAAGGDQLWTEVVRVGTRSGINHVVTLSAPDTANLRAAITEFRKLAEPPRVPQVSNVRSLAVVPVGGAAPIGVAPLLGRPALRPHLLTPEQWKTRSDARRLDGTDEVILIARNLLGINDAPTVNTLCTGHSIGSGDTVAWRETKPGGGVRAIFSAPNPDMLAEALRRCVSPFAVPETPTVLLSARDLRQVRRIAVAGVRGGAGGSELARRLASRAATELRGLDTFEVLERAGLNEILGEIALGQAGITQAKDRARVQQMAAADALLIVEVTDAGGHTEYQASCERITAKMTAPPRRPSEPSRLKYAVSFPDSDRLVRAVTEALLSKSVGTKSDAEYKRDLNRYNNEALPEWQNQVDAYNESRAQRTVAWREQIIPRHTCIVSGSLRLVDLADGLVLWESPFTQTLKENGAQSLRTVSTRGEDSAPVEKLDAENKVPDLLIARAAEAALLAAVQNLKATALLPETGASAGAISTVTEQSVATANNSGRVMDIDGDQVLVGIGRADGVRLGDTLSVSIGNGQTVLLVTTRVRPRTCDCVFAKGTAPNKGAKVIVGMTAAAVTPAASSKSVSLQGPAPR